MEAPRNGGHMSEFLLTAVRKRPQVTTAAMPVIAWPAWPEGRSRRRGSFWVQTTVPCTTEKNNSRGKTELKFWIVFFGSFFRQFPDSVSPETIPPKTEFRKNMAKNGDVELCCHSHPHHVRISSSLPQFGIGFRMLFPPLEKEEDPLRCQWKDFLEARRLERNPNKIWVCNHRAKLEHPKKIPMFG